MRKVPYIKDWKWIIFSIVVIFLFTQTFEVNMSIKPRLVSTSNQEDIISKEGNSFDLEAAVIPQNGIVLPVRWDNLGKQMIEVGVIDANKFEAIYERLGGLNEDEKKFLYGENNGNLTINKQNSRFILNLLWAFGLSNKNPILEEGPMIQYGDGDAGRFASTGGWTLARGSTMDHYSKYEFVVLTSKQQELVERVSKNIYRPCCGNSTYFPDCNHGMAMLGLLELMASQNATEEDLYKTALQVNSYWFPDTYLTIAKYFQERDVSWDKVESKEILSSAYSSATGYRQIRAEVGDSQSSGGSCGV